MKILKITILTIGILVFLIISLLIGSFAYADYLDSKFYDIKIPDELKNLQRPVEGFSNRQIDSLKRTNSKVEKLIITGYGYGGYDFYFWHKSEQKGEIYIRAFELTQNVELMETELIERTKKRIDIIDNKYHFHQAHSVIFEGTFEKYYPTKFELWFKSDDGVLNKKITEVKYLIDGWDR